MEIIKAIILGIIEGLTEFLPISSTGHLLISQDLLKYKDTAEVFTVVIQLGAILAVISYYWKKILNEIKGLFSNNKSKALRFWLNIIIATIPAGIAGLLIESKLSALGSLHIIALALILGGVAIILIEDFHTPKPAVENVEIEKIKYSQALKIGFYQIIALIPGVSRSGATIMGGMLSGLDRVTATAMSFYLSIPVMFLASGYKLVKHSDELKNVTGGSTAIIIGTISSFITSLLVIRWLLKYVSKHNFKPFAYYRIILGFVILISLIIVK